MNPVREVLALWFVSLVARVVILSPSKREAVWYLVKWIVFMTVATSFFAWMALGDKPLDADSFMARFSGLTDPAAVVGAISGTVFWWVGILTSIVRLKRLDWARNRKSAIGLPAGPEPPPRRSGDATASLIPGLFSFVPVVGLLAVISGHLARASIRRSGGRLLGGGMAAFGLILGYLGLGGWIIYALTVVPLLPSSLRRQNETGAIGCLRTINTAIITYAATYDCCVFPPSLAALGPPKTGLKKSAQAAGLISEVLASGRMFDYQFTYAAGPETNGHIETYAIHADPVTPGLTGEKHFFTDEMGVIRVEIGKEANRDSPPIIE